MTDDQIPWDDAAGHADDDADSRHRGNPYVIGDHDARYDRGDVDDDADDSSGTAADDNADDADELAYRPRMPRWLALLIAVAVIAAGAGGFTFRRAQQGGSAINCSYSESASQCYGGFTPLEPSGERFATSAAAADYFSTAVQPVYPADESLRRAVLSGNLNAVHQTAKTARNTTLQAARTLASRTWPNELDKPIRAAIAEYQHRASIYANLTRNTDWQAIEDLLFRTLSATQSATDVQQLIRTRLELDPASEPAAPLDVTAVKDMGDCDQLTFLDGKERTVTRHCVAITVTSHVPADVPYLSMRLNLLDKDGTVVAGGLHASGMSDADDPNAIHDGGTVTLTVGINPRIVRSGYRLAADGWSVHTADDLIISDDYTVAQAAALASLNAFRIP
ncbi:hypothetical protein [Bifidobacterium biavatii]|uniref:Uncharacterized protein n=1 Tax=Bifidobacterium biavatii DSM 23969 TaxID=1437608 RepID=A0A086ZT36_9BIFI|nr:hypothetical protein [Bifidobacterium biavatii]KFI49686.1 hypothetical protein BBIA_1220 [Bifidobacterium biavatii DSM 23969]